MTDDKKEVLQQTIDNLLYIEEYKDKLIEFNKQFDNFKKIKLSHDITKFKFSLDKAI